MYISSAKLRSGVVSNVFKTKISTTNNIFTNTKCTATHQKMLKVQICDFQSALHVSTCERFNRSNGDDIMKASFIPLEGSLHYIIIVHKLNFIQRKQWFLFLRKVFISLQFTKDVVQRSQVKLKQWAVYGCV